jgi:hypothetical protein
MEASMARRATYLLIVTALGAGCSAGQDTGDDPACQIQVEGERTPGYPYDLEQYTNNVLPVLAANCAAAGCHAPPNGNGGFSVWAAAAPGNCDFAKTFNSLTDAIDLANPENSAILVAVTGGDPLHPVQYPEGDAKRVAIEGYISDAKARYDADGGGGTAPPGASPFDYAVFQSTIQPIINDADGKGCAISGCHLTGAGGFSVKADPAADSEDMKANFIAITSITNLNAPDQSLFYLQATHRHGGGNSAVVSADQAEAILAWIEAAKDASGGTPIGCAPVDRFNVNVFRDEILPVLRGDVDYNNPGGAGVGCTRGPCHGTDRGPGALTLKTDATPQANLEQFACFVDLLSPSTSNVLLCPLDDPRCIRSPHPGQDVFTGADDLNYQRTLAYLYGSKLDASPLDFAFFVRRINPIFNDLQAVENGAQGRTCADAIGCHGVSVAGQAPPNGSNFPIIPNAGDVGRLTFNLSSASSFVDFLSPEESSLFLYPTNEIANVEDHPLATGLPHPGGTDFAIDSKFATDILRWAGGLRPDNQGFLTDFLVAGDYAASRVTDLTPIDEVNSTPAIFDPTYAAQFNAGEWDGFFAEDRTIDLNQVFPRDATAGRVAYAVVYLVNTTPLSETAQMTITSPNAVRAWVGTTLVAQADDASNGVAAVAVLPAYSTEKKATRILVKLFQSADDNGFEFTLQLRDELGNPLTDTTGEIVALLGPQGGI